MSATQRRLETRIFSSPFFFRLFIYLFFSSEDETRSNLISYARTDTRGLRCIEAMRRNFPLWEYARRHLPAVGVRGSFVKARARILIHTRKCRLRSHITEINPYHNLNEQSSYRLSRVRDPMYNCSRRSN